MPIFNNHASCDCCDHSFEFKGKSLACTPYVPPPTAFEALTVDEKPYTFFIVHGKLYTYRDTPNPLLRALLLQQASFYKDANERLWKGGEEVVKKLDKLLRKLGKESFVALVNDVTEVPFQDLHKSLKDSKDALEQYELLRHLWIDAL